MSHINEPDSQRPEHVRIAEEMSKEIMSLENPLIQQEIVLIIRDRVLTNLQKELKEASERLEHLESSVKNLGNMS